jgi:hypothetical protein
MTNYVAYVSKVRLSFLHMLHLCKEHQDNFAASI